MIHKEDGQSMDQEKETFVRQAIPDGPASLPSHIRAIGEHHQLANSSWWIGYACPAYEDVHIQGIVIYNRTTHIFLSGEEATHAQTLLPVLLRQGPMSLEPGSVQLASV